MKMLEIIKGKYKKPEVNSQEIATMLGQYDSAKNTQWFKKAVERCQYEASERIVTAKDMHDVGFAKGILFALDKFQVTK